MISMKGLTRYFFVIILAAVLRKLGNIAACGVKTFVVIFFLIIIWIYVTMRNTVDDNSKMPQHLREVNGFPSESFESKIQQPYLLMDRFEKNIKHDKNITTGNPLDTGTEIDTKLLKMAQANNTKGFEKNEVEYIKLKIEEANKEQIIYNEDIFGRLNNDSLVILVQVHKRVNYLQHLIDSLAKARYIDQALIIFSHDIYEEEINDLIKAIKFCKVMQIFFPYSIQTHPDTFPGADVRDCPRNIGKQKALQIGCLNAEYPDKFSHYRESKFTQIKHHWWWKMNHVFNNLNATKKYSGFVLFLEEDHYVAEDFIHLLRLMGRQCETKPQCKFLGLGLDIMKPGPSNQAIMSLFHTNLGLAFNRETYLDSIKKCAKEFCEFDDYNWDWSLNYITNKCGKGPKLSMILRAQRVFHIGECGTHSRNANCDVGKVLAGVKNEIKSLGLYPTNIELTETKVGRPKMMENGGWGDKRDHELCLKMTRTIPNIVIS
ncbi:unnamed protein product [Ceutorhynchus assimilis]|uniref:Alpha-1,6-mannosyl-glycoprotein 2-beta-N-acetylglucosaminyltransferase n=1 Tax=Ceutorhynchus assimilis TaxID=467358 RepID=A0A9P0GQ39_9CUCU|nr:unnamed protein product [Ceutorhynchus assimilis]